MLKFDKNVLKFDNILKSYPLQTFVQTFEINIQLILTKLLFFTIQKKNRFTAYKK